MSDVYDPDPINGPANLQENRKAMLDMYLVSPGYKENYLKPKIAATEASLQRRAPTAAPRGIGIPNTTKIDPQMMQMIAAALRR